MTEQEVILLFNFDTNPFGNIAQNGSRAVVVAGLRNERGIIEEAGDILSELIEDYGIDGDYEQVFYYDKFLNLQKLLLAKMDSNDCIRVDAFDAYCEELIGINFNNAFNVICDLCLGKANVALDKAKSRVEKLELIMEKGIVQEFTWERILSDKEKSGVIVNLSDNL